MKHLLAGLALLAGVLWVERGLHKPHTPAGWFDYHLNGGGV